MDPRTPDPAAVDLDAFHAEIAGLLLHAALYAEAAEAEGLAEPTPPRTPEEWAHVVHGVVGDAVDDLTFGRLVDAIYWATA